MFEEKRPGRIRNLKIRIFNYIIDNKLPCDFVFDKAMLSKKKRLLLRESDFNILNSQDWIVNSDKGYHLSDKGKILIGAIKKKQHDYKAKHGKSLESLEKQLATHYNYMKAFFEPHNYGNNDEKDRLEFRKRLDAAIDICEILHWVYLPEYDDVIVTNRRCDPEKETRAYYDHYHAVEDMVDYIEGRRKTPNKKGDVNLNVEFELKVFTERWGHYDFYRIKRTVDGWWVNHLSHQGHCDKKCSPVLFNILEHDSVNYPLKLADAMGYLWEIADDQKLSPKRLQAFINQIGKWISDTERGKPKFLTEYAAM